MKSNETPTLTPDDIKTIELLKELQSYLSKSSATMTSADKLRAHVICLELRHYSDAPDRVVPLEVVQAFGPELRMIALDTILATMMVTILR